MELARVFMAAQCSWHEAHCHSQHIGPVAVPQLESCLEGLSKQRRTQGVTHLQVYRTSCGWTLHFCVHKRF